jgi:hypothetical protein
VLPAAHVSFFPPLHVIVHAAVPPQTTVQPVLPWQSAVQPPFGQLMLHELLPVHDTVEPVSTVTVHDAPPPHVTVLLVPVEMLQLLVPVQVDVQFDVHVWLHVDCPLQLEVHPVLHVEVQVFLDSHLYVTFAGPAPASLRPESSAAPPIVQLPPCLHEHVLPTHSQSPVHVAVTPGLSLPPQPIDSATPIATPLRLPRIIEAADRDMGHLQELWIVARNGA